MGCEQSNLSKAKIRKSKNRENGEKKDNKSVLVSDAELIAKRDAKNVNIIKKDLNETPELFVLNNVLMSTMFLRNYQDEIYQVSKFIEKVHDNFWEPHVIVERVNRNVIYRRMHGTKKNIAEQLVTRKIYVPMNEYVQVLDPINDEGTARGNGSRYQVKIEESKRQGFVKLQRISSKNYFDSISNKDVATEALSNNSASSDTESSCTSNGTVAPENLQLIRNQTDQGTLDDCFVYRRIKRADADIQLEDMDHENLTDSDVYDTVSYLPSRKFMKYFQSKVFKESIAKQLGFIQYEIDNAVVDEHVPGKVFCNVRDENGNSCPVEIMPCLKTSWPHKQTFEFFEAKRQLQAEDVNYIKWPSEKMMDKMKQFECVLVPKGYSRKRGEYPEGDLEWEIHFPLAERYLETLLRPEQIKCYLVLLTIYKEYLQLHTKSHGVVPEHLLQLILWESEEDYNAWPEHRLGFKLLSIIKRLSNSLSKRHFPDYFIRKKNNFKNISRKYLEPANEVFHKIKQSPAMMVLRALRNVRYTSGSFYPPLNYKEVLDILYKKDWEENPYLGSLPLNEYSADEASGSSTSLEKKPKFNDAEKQLAYVKEKERRRRLKEKRERENSVKNGANLSYNVSAEGRRNSCDSVKEDWECEKRFDLPKKIALLKFFINHYLDIAKTSFQIGSKTQTLFYLKQAWYLTRILEQENQLFAAEVVDLFKVIRQEEAKVINAMQENLVMHGTLDVINTNSNNLKNNFEVNLTTLDNVSTQKHLNGNNINTDDIHHLPKSEQICLETLC